MKAKRGKRVGLRARSKNARVAARRYNVEERDELNRLRLKAKAPAMHFVSVIEGAPAECTRVLVRLNDGAFRYGMVVGGFFAAYHYNTEEFVQMAHPERITHWMEIIDPVPRVPAMHSEETFVGQPGAPPERGEDVYA